MADTKTPGETTIAPGLVNSIDKAELCCTLDIFVRNELLFCVVPAYRFTLPVPFALLLIPVVSCLSLVFLCLFLAAPLLFGFTARTVSLRWILAHAFLPFYPLPNSGARGVPQRKGLDL